MSTINTYNLPGSVSFEDSQSKIISTASFLCSSFLIPRGTIKPNDVINLQAVLTKGNAASNFGGRFYWNQTNSLIGAVTMSQVTLPTNGNHFTMNRMFAVDSNGDTILFSTDYDTTRTHDLSFVGDDLLYRSIVTITSINWDIDSYVIFANIGSGCTFRYFRLIK